LNLKSMNRTEVSKIVGFSLLFILGFEFLVHSTLYTSASNSLHAAKVKSYLDYGRSIEMKLKTALGSEDDSMSDLSKAGWIQYECRKRIAVTKSSKRSFSMYGMSFSSDIAHELVKVDPTFEVVPFAGPAAPLNHTYRCFKEQMQFGDSKNEDQSEIQVMSILASAVVGMLSTTGATTGFESPAAFTYPRYRLIDGALEEQSLPINKPSDWRLALSEESLRSALLKKLADTDLFYKPIIFDEGISDYSVSLRLLKRAYGQREIRAIREQVLTDKGFVERADIGPVLGALVGDFVEQSRKRGKRPILILIHDQKSNDSLFRLLEPLMAKENIEFISTHTIASSTDPRNFIADGHFTKEANIKIASSLRSLMLQKSSVK
jgi:hypothetical protein